MTEPRSGDQLNFDDLLRNFYSTISETEDAAGTEEGGPSGSLQLLDHLPFFFRISSYHIVNSVCCSHPLVSGPTSKRPSSAGGLCSGQLLVMWSAVCSGLPHSHAALSASPHFFMDALYRPTPVRSLFRVVQYF